MTDALFFVPELGSDDRVELRGSEAHHAATVKRVTVGERVQLADGRGNSASGHVDEVSRDRVVLRISQRTCAPEPDPRLVVVQALPKGERADLAVEAMTELGVDEIVPWAALRSVSVWKGADKADRGVAKWQRTAVEASKQSRRARFPVVTALADTATVQARVAAAAGALLLHEDAGLPLAGVRTPATGELLLVVGPEGGLAPIELELFAAAGAQTVRLGPEVLRTSTAGAAALAVLSVSVGRWR